MSILDELDNSRADVRSVCREEAEERIVWMRQWDNNMLYRTHGWHMWMSFLPPADSVEEKVKIFERLIREIGGQFPGVSEWSPVFVCNDSIGTAQQIIVGFDFSVRSAYAAVRLVISILSMMNRVRIAAGGILKFSFFEKDRLYNALYHINYWQKFKTPDSMDNVRSLCKIICGRPIEDREWEHCVEKTVRHRNRVKMSFETPY